MKISIVMPVLNRGDMIEKAIQSVINQHYPQTELIIVDGGSTDNTLDVIRRYEKHIAFWSSKPDGSAAVATNAGIARASGDVVALLMSDDYYEPGLFHDIAKAYAAHPDADVFTCGGQVVSLDNKTLAEFQSEAGLALNFYNICYGATAICFRFIRKSLYERIGGYLPFHADGKQMLTNDKEFLLRAVLYGVRNVYVSHPGYTHVAHEGSYSFGNQKTTFERHCLEHMAIATEYLSKSHLSFRQRLFLRYWYHDQAAKLCLFYLCNKDVSSAARIMLQAMKKSPFVWPGVFCTTGVRAVLKRCGLGL